MRFTVISEAGTGLGIATHLSSEGHAVNLVTESPSNVGIGIVSRDEGSIPDILILDSERFGKLADEYRKQGLRTLGASQWSSTIKDNSEYMKNVIKIAGWNTDKVKEGDNVYITAWFNGTNFISVYISIVYHRLMSGGCGPDLKTTGFVSNFQQPTSKVYTEFLKPLEPILRRVNHRGCVHIHALVNGEDYSVKDFSAEMFSPLALAMFENSKSSLTEILLKLFDENSGAVSPLEPWSVGILISVPPYPYEADTKPIPLVGLQIPALKHVWLMDAMKEKDIWSSAGINGKVGYITARGGYIQEAAKRVYRTISNLHTEDLQYRNDIGKDLSELFNKLRINHWIN